MATFLLDTSVIIDMLNEKRNRSALLFQLLSDGHLLACCPINITEIYAGMRPKEGATTGRFWIALHIFPLPRQQRSALAR